MDSNTRYEQGYIYGTASLHKSSTLSVRVRARFDPEGWSTWSEPVNLHCFVTDTPATSLQLAEGDKQPRHRQAGHQRHRQGGRDPERHHVGHRRPRRARLRSLLLPVVPA